MRVVRHYLRISQENRGADFNADIAQGTCTMKYSPKVHETIIRTPKLFDLHSLKDEASLQEILEILWSTQQAMAEISGMLSGCLQTQAGSAAIWANIAMIRTFHESNGDGEARDEAVTTIFSHPSNAACSKAADCKVITLMPDADDYPDIAALRAAVSRRTAALLITNPEDSEISNEKISAFVQIVHEIGGLASYGHANAYWASRALRAYAKSQKLPCLTTTIWWPWSARSQVLARLTLKESTVSRKSATRAKISLRTPESVQKKSVYA